MQSKSVRSRGQTLTEVLIAVIFLATGGLVVYSSVIRSMGEAEWEADKVFAQGMLRDLVETYGAVDWIDFNPANDKLAGVIYDIPLNDPQQDDKALKECSAGKFQDAITDDTPMGLTMDGTDTGGNLTPLQWRSFLRTDSDLKTFPAGDTKAGLEKDPAHKMYQEYLATIRRIEAKRCVLFQKDTNNSAVLTCYVFYTTGNTKTFQKASLIRFDK